MNLRSPSILLFSSLISGFVYGATTDRVDEPEQQNAPADQLAQSNTQDQPQPVAPPVDDSSGDAHVYVRAGLSQLHVSAQARLQGGLAFLPSEIRQKSQDNLLRLTVGRQISALWNMELTALLNTSGRQSYEFKGSDQELLFATSLTSVFLSAHRQFPLSGSRITPYVGINLAYGRFTSTSVGSLVQSLRYSTPKIAPVWALGASLGANVDWGQNWGMSADLSWLPAKITINSSSSLSFAPPIQARVKLKLVGLNLSIRRKF
jgi:outer membrane protein W